jgi:hypothetical protein
MRHLAGRFFDKIRPFRRIATRRGKPPEISSPLEKTVPLF